MKKVLLILIISFFSIIKLNAVEDISINNQKLIPDFNINTKNYNVFVNSKTEIITINVTPGSNELITGSGSISLKEGLNKVEIKVYKEEELIDSYTLNITRGEEKINTSLATLNDIRVSGVDLNFSSDVFNYNIDYIDNLNIDYTTPYPNMNVLLKKTKDKITIKVTSIDKSITNTYNINIKQEKNAQKETSKTSIFDKKEFSPFELKIIRISIILTISIILIIIFYFVFIKKRTNKVLNISHSILHK